NEREKGIEGRIVNATLRDLSTKLAKIQDQLVQPENMSLLGDVRMLVNFVQEQHGNPFRRVGLSALLDAIDKAPKPESCEMPRKDDSGKSSPGGLAPPSIRGDQASLRRGLFKKRDKTSHDSMLKSGADDSDADSSPSTPRTASSIDDGLSPLVSAAILKKKSAPKLHFAFNLLKSSKADNMDEECSDSETADECNDIDEIDRLIAVLGDGCVPNQKNHCWQHAQQNRQISNRRSRKYPPLWANRSGIQMAQQQSKNQ
ncbi:hypothetical protein NECAME_10985, partial [Necator americanus]